MRVLVRRLPWGRGQRPDDPNNRHDHKQNRQAAGEAPGHAEPARRRLSCGEQTRHPNVRGFGEHRAKRRRSVTRTGASQMPESAAMKRALITGVTGQDGSYLAELLLDQGYEV